MRREENINTKISSIEDYFKCAISIDCLIFGYDEAEKKLLVLTLRSDIPPFEGDYSLIGDLVKSDETLEEAAFRTLKDRAGVKDVFLKQVYTFGEVNRHPVGRVVTVAYYALVNVKKLQIDHSQGFQPTWQEVNHLLTQKMAFDHKAILQLCLKHIRKNIIDLPVENMLPTYFTLSQLQSLYEAILNRSLDKRNFRKRVHKLNLVKETSRTQTNVAHRPAKLYRLNKKTGDVI